MPENKKSNFKMVLILVGVVIGMFVFAYFNVPLFKLYCQKVGIALSPNAKASGELKSNGRQITVLFTGVVAGKLPVAFNAKDSFQKIVLGKPSKNEYHFVNLSNDTIYFRPVHSVLPQDAATKLTLTKCFCFDGQTILPHQEYTLPVIYSFSSDLDSDVENVTMHYTLFQKERKNTK